MYNNRAADKINNIADEFIKQLDNKLQNKFPTNSNFKKEELSIFPKKESEGKN